MARPINPTPTLKGEDIVKFAEDLDRLKHDPKKEKFLDECDEVFKKVKKDLD